MKSVPVSIVIYMVHNKTPENTKKVKYKDKVYKFNSYTITKADFAKVLSVEGQAAMRLGVHKIGKEEIEINAKSIPMSELKAIIAEYPFLGILSIAKGTYSDTGATKYLVKTAIAFKTADEFRQAMIETLKVVDNTKEKKDSQKNKVYAWEGVFFKQAGRKDTNWKATSLNRLKKISATILKHFNIPEDKAIITSQGTKSKSKLGVTRTFRDDISTEMPTYTIINVFDATPDTLIHELAHVVTRSKYKKGEVSGHGPEFCGVYAHVLGLFGAFEEDAVIDSMSKAGLQVKKFTMSTTKIGEL